MVCLCEDGRPRGCLMQARFVKAPPTQPPEKTSVPHPFSARGFTPEVCEKAPEKLQPFRDSFFARFRDERARGLR